jgi:hypothetical protein
MKKILAVTTVLPAQMSVFPVKYTGAVEVFALINSPTPESYGFITLGDGYLYLSDRDKIYQIDSVTMIVSSTPYFDFKDNNIFFSGLTNYSESCNSPDCKASIKIDVLSVQPYCSVEGVQLNADGNGIRGEEAYEWTLPDKSVVPGKLLTARLPGMYYILYSGITDFCGAKDSIYLDITASPWVSLGEDKILCEGTTIGLDPETSTGIDNYLWQDNSMQTTFTLQSPGTYFVNVSNICGAASDTM